MEILEYFKRDFKETEQEIRKQIEEGMEPIFEEEREKGYAECALEVCDEVSIMTARQKEDLRIKCLAELKKIEQEARQIWDRQIRKMTIFHIGTFYFMFFGSILTVFLLGLRLWTPTIISSIVVLVVFIISRISSIYAKIMAVFISAWKASEKLFILYNRYGRTEATLKMADYRGFSKKQIEERRWIFSTTHATIIPPS